MNKDVSIGTLIDGLSKIFRQLGNAPKEQIIPQLPGYAEQASAVFDAAINIKGSQMPYVVETNRKIIGEQVKAIEERFEGDEAGLEAVISALQPVANTWHLEA